MLLVAAPLLCDCDEADELWLEWPLNVLVGTQPGGQGFERERDVLLR